MLNMKGINPEAYYSPKDVTMFLNIKIQTVYLWVSQGKFKNIKRLGTRRTFIKGQDILDLIK